MNAQEKKLIQDLATDLYKLKHKQDHLGGLEQSKDPAEAVKQSVEFELIRTEVAEADRRLRAVQDAVATRAGTEQAGQMAKPQNPGPMPAMPVAPGSKAVKKK
jgi:hypothetical protein